MRAYVNYVLSAALVFLFAYINSYFPGLQSLLIFLYIAVVMGITMFFTGRSARKTIRDIEYILGGSVLHKADRELVAKLKNKDLLLLSQELKGQGVLLLTMILPIIIFLVLVMTPAPREFFQALSKSLGTTGREATFFSFVLFYFSLFGVSILFSQINRLYYKKRGGMLLIPSEYVITDRGIVLDNRTPVLFPINRNVVKVNSKRRFVELESSVGQAGSRMSSRVRLYATSPRKIYDLIISFSSEEGR